VVLLVSLFLHWYTPGVSAWNVFEVIDLLLALTALTAVLAAVHLLQPDLARAIGTRASERTGVTAGTVALVLVASQILNHPPAAQGAGVMFGAWLALGASLLMLAGGLVTIAWAISVRVTVDRQAQRRPPATPPAAPSDETSELP
jgi:hypothetical protein